MILRHWFNHPSLLTIYLSLGSLFQGPVEIKQNEISDLHTDFPNQLLAADPAISLSILVQFQISFAKKKKKNSIPCHRHHISIVPFQIANCTYTCYVLIETYFVGKISAAMKLDWKCFI